MSGCCPALGIMLSWGLCRNCAASLRPRGLVALGGPLVCLWEAPTASPLVVGASQKDWKYVRASRKKSVLDARVWDIQGTYTSSTADALPFLHGPGQQRLSARLLPK